MMHPLAVFLRSGKLRYFLQARYGVSTGVN